MTTGASVHMHLYTQNKQNVIKIIFKNTWPRATMEDTRHPISGLYTQVEINAWATPCTFQTHERIYTQKHIPTDLQI